LNIKANTKQVTKVPDYPKGIHNPEASYAFVIDWKQPFAPKALSMLWQKKYRVRSARKPFSDGVKEYSEGSLIVLLGRNLDKLDHIQRDMMEISETAHVHINGYNTGRMPKGIDLTSRDSRPVKMPKVAMLIEPPFSTYTSGQLYFLFDQVTALPVERIRTSIFKQTAAPKFGSRYGYADLNDYDVLILPGGGSGLKQLFGKKQIAAIKEWVSSGGVLVATESAARFFTKKESGLTQVELIKTPKDSSETAKLISFAERRDYNGKKNIPGAALRGSLDNTNPLAFGMPDQVYSLKFGTEALKPGSDFQTVGRYHPGAEELLASGYVSGDNLKRLAGNTFAGVQPLGQGKVVFLLDNTQYRMFWVGPARLMQNAVMLLKGM